VTTRTAARPLRPIAPLVVSAGGLGWAWCPCGWTTAHHPEVGGHDHRAGAVPADEARALLADHRSTCPT
jgi:hypothetical protein